MKRILSHIFPVLFLLALVSCESSFHDERLLGTWVSTNNLVSANHPDTLIIGNEYSLSKPFIIVENNYSSPLSDGISHSFEYSYNKIRITIRYIGPNLILVQPTTHEYELKNNELTIDFSNGVYGFESKRTTYIKQ